MAMDEKKDDQDPTVSEFEHSEIKPMFTDLELTLIAEMVNSIINPTELKMLHHSPGLATEILGAVLQELKDSPDIERYILMDYSHEDDVIYFITKMCQEKKIWLTKVIASNVPFDLKALGIKAQERFKRISKVCGLPWEIANEILTKTYKKWYYTVRCHSVRIGLKRYCFETREVAEQVIKFLSCNNEIEEWRVFEGDDTHVYVCSFDEFKSSIEKERQYESERERVQWYAQPAFIANDVTAWLDSMVERKRKEWGQ